MLFNSLAFALFLPIVFIIYWLIPHRFRWVLILISSYYFYMNWNPKYILIIWGTTVISYIAGILLERAKNCKLKKIILTVAAIASLGILFIFKYIDFLSESVAGLLGIFSLQVNPLMLKLVLPVGISFYTFQTLSYVIDVYKGNVKAEYHFGYYAAFVSFFPQLVAGPIERTGNLLPQIKDRHTFDYEQATYGLKLMAWGYFKKLVIADTLAQYVGNVYDTPHQYHGFSFVLATLFFTFQIYCDFSGYSDIAIGTAKLLGINLMTNFKSPYFSQSVKEFWSRWHISLSTWFRDYIYIPLGGNRKGKIRRYFNVMMTFLVSGLWHGANWTFVFWGGIHGIAQVLENIWYPFGHVAEKKQWLRILGVFVFCSFAWIFFAAGSIGDAIYIVTHLFQGITRPAIYIRNGFSEIGMGKAVLLQELFAILLLLTYDYASLKADVIVQIGKGKTALRWGTYIFICLIILFFSWKGVAAEFVYFQF